MNEVAKIVLVMLIVVLAPASLVGIWYLAMRFLSVSSGWTKLAERYHFQGNFKGKYYRWQSAKIKKTDFGSSLNMGVNEQGLYLVPMIVFRLFHKPLLIPWGEIQVEPFKKLFFFKCYRLTFRSFPEIPMKLDSRTFGKMTDHLKIQTGNQQYGSTLDV